MKLGLEGVRLEVSAMGNVRRAVRVVQDDVVIIAPFTDRTLLA